MFHSPCDVGRLMTTIACLVSLNSPLLKPPHLFTFWAVAPITARVSSGGHHFDALGTFMSSVDMATLQPHAFHLVASAQCRSPNGSLKNSINQSHKFRKKTHDTNEVKRLCHLSGAKHSPQSSRFKLTLSYSECQQYFCHFWSTNRWQH